ncbi:MAG: hypothetical protein ACRD2O_01240, partial [Terriglobia bacterium]
MITNSSIHADNRAGAAHGPAESWRIHRTSAPMFLVALGLGLLFVSGCSRQRAAADESSGSGGASAASSSQAQLFTVATDQMAHVQV